MKTYQFPVIFLHCPAVYALEVIYVYCICVVKVDERLLHMSSQLPHQGLHVGSLKPATMGYSTLGNWHTLQIDPFSPPWC